MKSAIKITSIFQKDWKKYLTSQSVKRKSWMESMQFQAKQATFCFIPGADGKLSEILLGVKDENDFWSFGALPPVLPSGNYRIDAKYTISQFENIALAWELGSYQFLRYKKKAKAHSAKLMLNAVTRKKALKEMIDVFYFVRDAINTPTEDFGPEELANAAEKIAEQFSAHFQQMIGDELLTENYPLIHAVGRAASRKPRLIDFTWGNEADPKVTLVGKGVCYDTGGLSIKSNSSMKPMKKDMAGAAQVLGLAWLLMANRFPVRLRVLIPAVENAVSGNSYRPGDVFTARDGTHVEIGDTDAEGRLILADALCEAVREKPDLVIDFATLTGAQRVAMGPDIPTFFTEDAAFSADLLASSQLHQDPIWPLPLYSDYKEYLKSDIADISNSSNQPYGGAITAALFLQHFVGKNTAWCHFDFMGANLQTRPGRPKGGEAQGLRAVFYALGQRYIKHPSGEVTN